MGLRKVVAILIAFLIPCVAVGVYATWEYTQGDVSDIVSSVAVEMAEKEWTGSDELPDQVQGELHYTLIEAIIDGDYGLNTPNSYINKEIDQRVGLGWFSTDTLGSMDYWERDNISKYFNTETENLSFLFYFPEGEGGPYYLYTTNVHLGGDRNPNFAIGTVIYPIYRTTIVYNEAADRYEAVETKIGSAKSAYYDNVVTGSLLKYPSFDATSWTEIELGGTMDKAINSYVGETTTAYMKNETTPIYYTFIAKEKATRTVTLNTTDHYFKVYVYDKNGNGVTATAGSQGGLTISWQTEQNESYYIKIMGGTVVEFSLS